VHKEVLLLIFLRGSVEINMIFITEKERDKQLQIGQQREQADPHSLKHEKIPWTLLYKPKT